MYEDQALWGSRRAGREEMRTTGRSAMLTTTSLSGNPPYIEQKRTFDCVRDNRLRDRTLHDVFARLLCIVSIPVCIVLQLLNFAFVHRAA